MRRDSRVIPSMAGVSSVLSARSGRDLARDTFVLPSSPAYPPEYLFAAIRASTILGSAVSVGELREARHVAATAFVLLLSLATVGAGADDAGPVGVGVVVGPDGRPAPGAEVIAAGGAWDGEPPGFLGRATADAEGRFSWTSPSEPSAATGRPSGRTRPGSVAASAPIDRDGDRGPAGPPDPGLAGPARVRGRRPRRPAGRRGPDRPSDGRPRGPGRPEALADLASATTDAGAGPRSRRSGPRSWSRSGSRRPVSGPRPATSGGRRPGRRRAQGDHPAPHRAGHGPGGRRRPGGGRRPDGPRRLGRAAGEALEAGIAEATTDGSGRFEVAAIAAGSLTVRVRPRARLARPARPGGPPGPGAGQDAVESRSRSAEGSASPASPATPATAGRSPGLVVRSSPRARPSPSRVWTDAQGRYEAYVPAGLVTHRVLRVPAPYLCPPDFLGPRPVEVPPAIARFELPPIALTRGVDLRGRSIDEDDRPVAGARVEASWTMFDGRVRAPRSAIGTSQARRLVRRSGRSTPTPS